MSLIQSLALPAKLENASQPLAAMTRAAPHPFCISPTAVDQMVESVLLSEAQPAEMLPATPAQSADAPAETVAQDSDM
ncbi:hypothetical protein D9M68_684160 [compost metagenome]